MPSSFRLDESFRPFDYRTPSPPKHAIEAISPDTADAAWGELFGHGPIHSRKCGGHLARRRISANLMRSPRDSAVLTPTTCTINKPQGTPRKRPLEGPLVFERPTKRPKSDVDLRCEFAEPRSTDDTSNPSNEDEEHKRLLEAQLLLNFSKTARAIHYSGTCPRPSLSDDLKTGTDGPDQTRDLSSAELNGHSAPTEKAFPVDSFAWKSGSTVYPQRGPEKRSIESLCPTNNLSLCSSLDEKNETCARGVTGETASVSLNTEYTDDQTLTNKHQGALEDVKGQTASKSPERTLAQTEFSLTGGATVQPSNGFPTKAETDNVSPSAPNIVALPKLDDFPPAKGSPPSLMTTICTACKFSRNSLELEGNNNAMSWINCDGCKLWFHFACAGFKTEREVRAVDKFKCKECKPVFGATTYVRKSSRAHSAIDYAGLHQGVIKTSDDRMEHHYIQPIRDGVITFLPETFARMRPDLVTAEFFEKSGGMLEPIIIPADLNPRPEALNTFGNHDILPTNLETLVDVSPSLLSGTKNGTSCNLELQTSENEGQDALGMVIPCGLTIRHVAELYGLDEKVEVIDVKSQNGESKKWNMKKWADYYESPDDKVVRNVISLEVSQSKLGRLIRRPKIVRDLDLQDSVWPEEQIAKGEHPRVQFYCLMSVADCFTDFHVDFGGSSVFYHILKGKKTFLFIPPKEKHLKKYEEWCMSPAQNWTFLADQTKECYRVDLCQGDTMLIPSGWIHAVWTPEDSLVIGGNFLTRMNFGMQLRIAQLEKATGVARKFSYPSFQKLHWFTAFRYLAEDPLPEDVRTLLHSGEVFYRKHPTYEDFDAWSENSLSGKANYHARYYSQPEIDGLPDLIRYLLRTALIDCGSIIEGITAEMRNAVKRSIPRSHGEPIDVIKELALWGAWKRGNEPIPHWAYPSAEPKTMVNDKLSATTIKRLDREAALQAALIAPRRQSARTQGQQDDSSGHQGEVSNDIGVNESSDPSSVKPSGPSISSKKARRLSASGAGLNRKIACEMCRKRRRACKHKDDSRISTLSEVDCDTPSNHEKSNGGIQTIGPMDDCLLARMKKSSPALLSLDEQPLSPGETSKEYVAPDESLDHSKGNHSLGPVSGNAMFFRSRTKACSDCRKSKRRCIHDADGNEDPMKIAEQVIPRPHARKSRKEIDTIQAPLPYATVRSTSRAPVGNMMADLSPCERSEAIFVKQDTCVNNSPRKAPSTTRLQELDFQYRSGTKEMQDRGTSDSAPDVSSSLGERRCRQTHFNEKSSVAGNPSRVPCATESPVAASALMSPPASSHNDIGNSPVDITEMHCLSPSTSRQTSQQPQMASQSPHTPESGALPQVIGGSGTIVEHDDNNDLPVASTILGPKYQHNVERNLGTTTDESSLRLIKELQVQDLGLRKRGRM